MDAVEQLEVGKEGMPPLPLASTHVDADGTLCLAIAKPSVTGHPSPDAQPLVCPICNLDDTQTEFGICRARPSGRNLYCKSCIRKKINDSRKALREYRGARRQGKLPLIGVARNRKGILEGKALKDRQHPYHERVLGAIHEGARTQQEIFEAILPKGWRTSFHIESDQLTKELDLIGDSLANLLAHPRRIQIETVDGIRVFRPIVPQRKADQIAPGSYRSSSGVISAARRWRAA